MTQVLLAGPLEISTQNLTINGAGVTLDGQLKGRVLHVAAGASATLQGLIITRGLLAGKGRVVVFVPPEPPPKGALRKAAQACVSTLHGQQADPLARPLFERYFREFYYTQALDARAIVDKLKVNPATLAVQFRSATAAFRMVEDEANVTVVVRYAEAKDDVDMLLGYLETKGPDRWLMRKLQRYTVSIRERAALKMLGEGSLKTTVVPGLYAQAGVGGLYDEKLGLYLGGVPFDALGNVL